MNPSAHYPAIYPTTTVSAVVATVENNPEKTIHSLLIPHDTNAITSQWLWAETVVAVAVFPAIPVYVATSTPTPLEANIKILHLADTTYYQRHKPPAHTAPTAPATPAPRGLSIQPRAHQRHKPVTAPIASANRNNAKSNKAKNSKIISNRNTFKISSGKTSKTNSANNASNDKTANSAVTSISSIVTFFCDSSCCSETSTSSCTGLEIRASFVPFAHEHNWVVHTTKLNITNVFTAFFKIHKRNILSFS